MSNSTDVNGQITDAVTQVNVKTLGEAPSQAMGMLYQIMSGAVSLGLQDAVTAQQQLNTLGNAATTMGVNLLLTMDPASAAAATQEVINGNSLAQQLSQLSATVSANQQFAKTAQNTPPVTG